MPTQHVREHSANEKALREQQDAGFATAAEFAEWEQGPEPSGPFAVTYCGTVHGWRTFAEGYRTLEQATVAAVELVTIRGCIAIRRRVRRMLGAREVVAGFEQPVVRAQEEALLLAA